MPNESLEFAIGRLPYASEIFGTYRPMVGWASKRKRDRIISDGLNSLAPFLRDLLPLYATGNVYSGPIEDRSVTRFDIGRLAGLTLPKIAPADDGTFMVPALQAVVVERLGDRPAPKTADEWRGVVNEDTVRQAYGNTDQGAVGAWVKWSRGVPEQFPLLPGESTFQHNRRLNELIYAVLDRESRLAAALIDLAKSGATDALSSLLLTLAPDPVTVEAQIAALQKRLSDPFLEIDPRDGLHGVSVSPLGIVHYFRQYFFELDTFLGPAVGHVWLTPGTTVELVESSTRRTLVETTTESLQELTQASERSDRTQEELGEAIKQENRSDTKLGFSTTVNQSWPSGDMSATGSINVDTTQQEARESTYKRMREQSEKLSTQIRTSYKTTFRTVTETTDVSSKRYVLSNPSPTDLQNYEMRRKMRRVAVQVQDIGTYLCWETFVDDPGRELGLANLVHIAKEPTVTPLPNPALIPNPERKSGVDFDIKAIWHGSDNRRYPTQPEGIGLGFNKIPVDVPDGYRIDLAPGQVVKLECLAARGEGDFGSYLYLAKYIGGNDIDVILAWGGGGLRWTHTVNLDLRGAITLVPTDQRLADIAAANKKTLDKADQAAAAAQAKAQEEAFYTAAQERIELASAIRKRKFEDLREEERTVVYRALIRELMAGWYDLGATSDKQRHVFATVLNAIFDVDRMLYFVAPEWWKPRQSSSLDVGGNGKYSIGPDKTVAWSDTQARKDNYLITGKSEPARLGSSLGWLLQLDGDDMRNRFLNAPWVRAVMPVRPGKEEAAIAWLTRAEVEGTEGLNLTYAAQPGEAEEITQGLAAAGQAASDPPTIGDAIRYLCLRVSEKHQESTSERLFPDRDGIDDGDKVWATPIDKVYEHGFYPLERSFRASPVEAPTDGKSRNFQIMAQWTEILPTDQVVPVVVRYNPITGRQIPPEE
ncbi:peptidoglycan-binding protein [Azotobacter chroococcum]|uniref:peptidoglycan-binding protein n=1 Tax=Azotobacter chroococcum TaxID=353 RepID=UPI00103A5334|nr:peptidoglycan-binding protein [Azotobacter chroococcum]TBW33922.1 peptidoglycan-binding protein [Azotobacter chroococcum]